MRNPWKALGDHGLVLPEDEPYVDAYNERASEKHRLDTTVLPQPFLGRRDADLVVLALNPGRTGWSDGPYAAALREDLGSEDGTAFPALREEFVDEEGKWWKRCLGPIAAAAAMPLSSMAYRVLAVEFLPYHSVSYRAVPVTLPSQRYSFHLVRAAIDRGAMIVVLRGERSWSVAVPELRNANVAFSSNPRAGVISPATFGEEAFGRIVAAVETPSRDQPDGSDTSTFLMRLAGELGDRYPMASSDEILRGMTGLVARGMTPKEAQVEFERIAVRPIPPISG